jgi:APA family basic amino acid/polyamine antiporter
MALTVGLYTWPQHAHAVAAVVALAVLAAVVIASLSSTSAEPAHLNPTGEVTPGGVLQAAGLLFFAFAGYARIAVLAIGAAAYGIRHGTSR